MFTSCVLSISYTLLLKDESLGRPADDAFEGNNAFHIDNISLTWYNAKNVLSLSLSLSLSLQNTSGNYYFSI